MGVEGRNYQNNAIIEVRKLGESIKDLEQKVKDIRKNTGLLFTKYSPEQGMDKIIDTIKTFLNQKLDSINYVSKVMNSGVRNPEITTILAHLNRKVNILIAKLNGNSKFVARNSKNKFDSLLADLKNIKTKIS